MEKLNDIDKIDELYEKLKKHKFQVDYNLGMSDKDWYRLAVIFYLSEKNAPFIVDLPVIVRDYDHFYKMSVGNSWVPSNTIDEKAKDLTIHGDYKK